MYLGRFTGLQTFHCREQGELTSASKSTNARDEAECHDCGQQAVWANFISSTSESRVLIDCGDKPGAEGEVPYLQIPEATPIADLDAVVLTHAPDQTSSQTSIC